MLDLSPLKVTNLIVLQTSSPRALQMLRMTLTSIQQNQKEQFKENMHGEKTLQ